MAGPGYSFLGEEERKNLEEVMSKWELSRYSHDVPKSTSFVQRLELATQEVFGVPYSVAVNSGTSALLTGLAALGIGPGDEVIVPGYTFIASIATIVYSGGTPVLAEIDDSFTIDPSDVEAKVTPRTRAIMPVHMLGAPCDMVALRDIADRHGLLIIEDVAQACGASYRGRRLGSFGDAAAFSLNQFKVITSGEGGFVLLANERLHQRAYSFQDQGWFPGRTDWGEGDTLFGINLRMPELAGAVACAQLDKLDLVIRSSRDVKRALAAKIPERQGMRRRRFNDPDGECGTLLVYVFDRAADAEAVVKELGTKTMRDSGHHYYGNMPQLAALTAGDVPPCPFQCNRDSVRQDYQAGTLPRTDDLLSRSVAVSVGVSDKYIGAGFGVTIRSAAADIERTADLFTAAVDRVLGG
jgi:dTDP-4-amino-4,6-dideoxygalactose transaminase